MQPVIKFRLLSHSRATVGSRPNNIPCLQLMVPVPLHSVQHIKSAGVLLPFIMYNVYTHQHIKSAGVLLPFIMYNVYTHVLRSFVARKFTTNH